MRDSPMKEINHSEYVCGTVHPNGVESFWLMLKRAYKGTFHKISPRDLNQCIQEFSSASSGLRQADTLAQMTALAVGLVGRRHGPFIADNGLPWEAGACHPRLKGYFGVPPGGIDASSHPIGNLSGVGLIGPCRSSMERSRLPSDDYPPSPKRRRETEWTMSAIPQRLLPLNRVYNLPVKGCNYWEWAWSPELA
ncbi:MAG: hypothetical protein M2R46_02125 [Verrucomicrobia subdivision 3 bacterium]|nr:hypothetical protein [Limisphaerales bacterium]